MPDLTIPQTTGSPGLDLEALAEECRRIIGADARYHPTNKAGTPKAPRARNDGTVAFRAAWRGDNRASAYYRPDGPGGRLLVWGDSGDKAAGGGVLSLAEALAVDLDRFRGGPAGHHASAPPRQPTTPPPTQPASAPAGAQPAPAKKPAEVHTAAAIKRWPGKGCAQYLYRDATGAPAMLVQRTPDKVFYPYHPAGLNLWTIGDPDGPLPLYHWPEILAADPHAPVLVVEGERDADNGAALGLVTTTASHGAGNAHMTDWAPLAGRQVVVIPDADQPGERHAADVARLAAEAGAQLVAIAWLPDFPQPGQLPEKHGHDLSDLVTLRRAAGADDAAIAGELLDLAAAAIAQAAGAEAGEDSGDYIMPEAWTFAEDLGHPEPTEWIIDPIVPADSLGLLYGESGFGKSLAAIDFSARAARQGPVLYIAAEGARGISRRIAAWTMGHPDQPIPPRRLIIQNRRTHLLDTGEVDGLVAAVTRAAENLGPIRLIVVDTLSRSIPGSNENMQDVMSAAIDACDRIRQAAGGATVLLIHHPGRNSTGPRGSSVVPGAVDFQLVLKTTSGNKPKPGDAITVEIDKMKDDASSATINYLFRIYDLDDSGHVTGAALVETGIGTRTTAPLFTAKQSHALAVLAELAQAGQPVAKGEWFRALDSADPHHHVSRSSLTLWCRDWTAAGIVTSPTPGTYLPGNTGPTGQNRANGPISLTGQEGQRANNTLSVGPLAQAQQRPLSPPDDPEAGPIGPIGPAGPVPVLHFGPSADAAADAATDREPAS